MIHDLALYYFICNDTDLPVEINGHMFNQNDQLNDVDSVNGMEVGIDPYGNTCVYCVCEFGYMPSATFKSPSGNPYTTSGLLSPRPHPTRPHIAS